jgi:sugar phosphate isomerase/epimerase
MRLALLSDVFRSADAYEVARSIAGGGFACVELNACPNWYPHVDFRRPEAERVAVEWRAALEGHGIRIPVVAAFTNLASLDVAEHAAAVAYCRRALASFDTLGSRVMTCMVSGSNLLPIAAQRQMLRAALLELAEDADRVGAAIAVEVYPGNFLERTEDALMFLDSLGAPNVGYLLCVSHVAALGEDVSVAYETAKPLVRHIHLSDTPVGTPEHRHLIPGLGQVDWLDLCQRVRRDGFDGYISAQIYSHEGAPAFSTARAFSSLAAVLAPDSNRRQTRPPS